jgi:hypothetical protein
MSAVSPSYGFDFRFTVARVARWPFRLLSVVRRNLNSFRVCAFRISSCLRKCQYVLYVSSVWLFSSNVLVLPLTIRFKVLLAFRFGVLSHLRFSLFRASGCFSLFCWQLSVDLPMVLLTSNSSLLLWNLIYRLIKLRLTRWCCLHRDQSFGWGRILHFKSMPPTIVFLLYFLPLKRQLRDSSVHFW